MTTSRFSAALTALATLVLAGSASAQLVRCPNGPCTGVDPGTRPRPAQYNSPPDMAVQFSTCLGSTSGAFLAENVRASLIGAMQELDSNHDDPPPNPDVRHMCVNNKSVVGGWLRPVGSYGSSDTATARNVALSYVKLLVKGETVALNVKRPGVPRPVR